MVKTRAQHRKQRIAKLWAKVESAQNVFYDILSRVPAKSIKRLKTVNKYWHRSISNKYFAEKQITQSRKNTSFILCHVHNSSVMLYSMEVESFELFYLNSMQPSKISLVHMISSFNGLICCVNQISCQDVESKFYDPQIWICNPCTGESLLLPQGRISFKVKPIFGVAYGSDISDYRVFRIYYDVGRYPYECEVYSSRSGSWKYIGPVQMNSHISLLNIGHVFVGGKIYWLVSLDEPGEILSVDLEGRFEVINLPKYGDDDLPGEDKITEGTHLFILKGCLALFVMHVTYMVIWIWKAKGEKYSWVCEHCEIIPFDEIDDIVLTVTSIKNKILCVTQSHWCTYDMDTRIWNMIRVPRNRFVIPAVFPFNESLMPCNGGVRL